MSQRGKLLAALDLAAGEYGLLRIEAARRVSPETTAAVDDLQHSLVVVNRLFSSTDDEDEEVETIRELWAAIAIVQDQIRRAHAAVEQSAKLWARTSGLKAAAQATVASSRSARRLHQRKR